MDFEIVASTLKSFKGFLYDTALRCLQVCLRLIQRRTNDILYTSNYLSTLHNMNTTNN